MKEHSDTFPLTSRTSPDPVVAELLAWIGRLPSIPLHRVVTELLVRLDRLHGSSLDLEIRFRMLSVLKGALLRVVAALPQNLSVGGAASNGLSLEQRLYDAMVRNCKRLLQDIDRDRYGDREVSERRRHWVIRNSFRFIGRQVLYAVKHRRSWPKGLWQDLHDLYVYLVVRGRYGETRVHSEGRDFHPVQAYKRLLVVGLVADLVDRRGIDGKVLAQLGPIADRCCLVEPEAMLGELGLNLVEVSCDRPVRVKPGRLEDPFRGWVLQAPADLEILLLNLDPFQDYESAAVAA